ncbi:ISL3 family transposase [Sporosalibacterium faouarense]|uniref:ISL3 family transposase n=1 Tax=Sporosalibacterium faouarense TaxID=516123 RepID=UPI00311CB801
MLNKAKIRKVCIDDFAIKKRAKYGTVMIDIESRKIVDILESRDYEDVKNWLETFPNIELVSRDGSIVYKKAVEDAHPGAIQINDRFHILKNLTDYFKQLIKRNFNKKVEVEKLETIKPEEILVLKEKYKYDTKWDLICRVKQLRSLKYTINDICKILGIGNKTVITYFKIPYEDKQKYDKVTNAKAKEMDTVNRKQGLINKAKELKDKGTSIRKIAEEMSLDRKTVKKYLEFNGCWEHGSKGLKRQSILDNYKEIIKQMHISGENSNEIYINIKKQGYKGSDSLIRKFITTLRNEIMEDNEIINIDYVHRKDLISLLYRPLEKVENITATQLDKLLKKYENLKLVFDTLEKFKQILFGKDNTQLKHWIQKCKTLNIRELNSFIKGITRDIDAVNNAILYKYSNGLAEGKINKIKFIKRIMYGRCSFQTLKDRVLSLENN